MGLSHQICHGLRGSNPPSAPIARCIGIRTPQGFKRWMSDIVFEFACERLEK